MISIYIVFFRLKNSLNRRVIFSKRKIFYRFELMTCSHHYQTSQKVEVDFSKYVLFFHDILSVKFNIDISVKDRLYKLTVATFKLVLTVPVH